MSTLRRIRSSTYRALALLLLPVGVFSQDATQPTIRVTTRLVEVSVIVRSKGQPVSDLKKEDFRVFDRGKEQKIATFALDRPDPTSKPATKLPPNIFSNRIQGASVSSSVTAILFDAVNTRPQQQAY